MKPRGERAKNDTTFARNRTVISVFQVFFYKPRPRLPSLFQDPMTQQLPSATGEFSSRRRPPLLDRHQPAPITGKEGQQGRKPEEVLLIMRRTLRHFDREQKWSHRGMSSCVRRSSSKVFITRILKDACFFGSIVVGVMGKAEGSFLCSDIAAKHFGVEE